MVTNLNTPLPALNTTLLRNLVNWVVASDAGLPTGCDWAQGSWATLRVPGLTMSDDVLERREGSICGSAYCMAGHAVVQSGYALRYHHSSDDVASATECGHAVDSGRRDHRGLPILVPDPVMPIYSISAKAREVLGLTYPESECFFSAHRRASEIVALSAWFAERRGLSLDLPEETRRVGDPADLGILIRNWGL